MKVKILKTDTRLRIKAGEIYEATSYDAGSKVALLARVPDGFDPSCGQYRSEVEILLEESVR